MGAEIPSPSVSGTSAETPRVAEMTEKKNPEARRADILAAAMAVFDERGFAAATIDAVAERAGIAKGSVYNYFPSKRDLFYHVLDGAMASIKSELAPALEDEAVSPAERLRRMLAYWFDQIAELRGFGRLVLEFWIAAAREGQAGQLVAALNQNDAYWLERIAGIIAKGVESGEFAGDVDPNATAPMIMATMDGVMLNTILGTGFEVTDNFRTAMTDSILRGLTRRPDAEMR